jgi:hypothetical protein
MGLRRLINLIIIADLLSKSKLLNPAFVSIIKIRNIDLHCSIDDLSLS